MNSSKQVSKPSKNVNFTNVEIDNQAALPDRLTPVIDFMTEDDLWAMQEIAEMEVCARMGRLPHFDDFSYSDR